MTNEEYIEMLKNGVVPTYEQTRSLGVLPFFNNEKNHRVLIGYDCGRNGHAIHLRVKTSDQSALSLDADGIRVLGIIEDVLYYTFGKSSEVLKMEKPNTKYSGDTYYSYDSEGSPFIAFDPDPFYLM